MFLNENSEKCDRKIYFERKFEYIYTTVFQGNFVLNKLKLANYNLINLCFIEIQNGVKTIIIGIR